MTGPVNLSTDVTVDATNAGGTPAGANIAFTSTINGGHNLTLTGGTSGTVSFGAVGGTTALTTFTATGATITQNSTAKATGAISYTGSTAINLGGNITTSGGIVTMTGPVNLNATTIIDTTNAGGTAAGANIVFSSTINGAQALTLLGGTGGAVSFGAVGGTTALTSFTATGATVTQNSTAKTTGALSYTGTSAINLGGNVTTSGGVVTMTGPVTLNAGSTVDTTNAGGTAAGANITFTSTIDGAQALTLTGGTSGTITLNGAIGSNTALTSLAATGAIIAQNSNVKTTGPVSYTGSNQIDLDGNITTSGAAVTMNGPVALTTTVLVDATNGGGTPAGANISFSSTINGAQALTLTGGTSGNVAVSGTVGGTTALTSLTVTGNALAFQNIGGASSGVSGTTTLNAIGSIAFNGTTYNANTMAFTAATNFNMNAGAPTSFSSNGGSLTFTTGVIRLSSNTNLTMNSSGGAITVGNVDAVSNNLRTLSLNAGSGPVQVGAIGTAGVGEFASVILSGGNLLIRGNIVTNNITLNSGALSTIYLGGSITTTNSAITFPSAVVRDTTNNVTISTGSTGANITFQSTIDGDVAYTRNLTLTAGTGNITLSGAVGATTPLGALTITSANNVTTNAITAGSITQLAGTGTTTFNGALNTNGPAGIVVVGNNFTFNGNITTTNGGPLTVTHTGLLTFGSGIVINLSGPFTDNGSGGGSTNLAGTIITNGYDIDFNLPVNLVGTALLSTGNGVGNINFASTLNGTNNLTLSTGNGNINFVGAVGGVVPLGAMTVTTANNFTANSLTLASFDQLAGTGTTTFNGPVIINGAAGFSFTGNKAVFNNTLTTTGNGPTTITNSGTLVLSSAALFNLDAAFTQSGTGSTQSAGSITTTSDPIAFNSPFILTGATTLNTGSPGANISFGSTVDGSSNLTLTAGTGNITFSGLVGGLTRIGTLTINSAANINAIAISAASINQLAASGTSTYAGDLNTNTSAGIALTGNIFSINGNLITTSSGPVAITNSGLLTLNGGASTSIGSTFTQSGGGTVDLSGTVRSTVNANLSFASPITLLLPQGPHRLPRSRWHSFVERDDDRHRLGGRRRQAGDRLHLRRRFDGASDVNHTLSDVVKGFQAMNRPEAWLKMQIALRDQGRPGLPSAPSRPSTWRFGFEGGPCRTRPWRIWLSLSVFGSDLRQRRLHQLRRSAARTSTRRLGRQRGLPLGQDEDRQRSGARSGPGRRGKESDRLGHSIRRRQRCLLAPAGAGGCRAVRGRTGRSVVRGAGRFGRPRRPQADPRTRAARHGDRGGRVCYIPDDFRRMLQAEAVDVQQADATRCGGVTGFLQAAALCEANHTDLSPIARRPCIGISAARRRASDTSNGSTTMSGSNTCFSRARRRLATGRSRPIFRVPAWDYVQGEGRRAVRSGRSDGMRKTFVALPRLAAPPLPPLLQALEVRAPVARIDPSAAVVAARRLNRAAGVIAVSVLVDSAVEHYRGEFITR